MARDPWLSIIGLGEDGPDGLTPASRSALLGAEIIMGPSRHLDLLGAGFDAERIVWPVPFVDGISELHSLKGRKVAVLASGDPFWFGAGSVVTRGLEPDEWRAFSGVSCFSLMAARFGVALEHVPAVALHAAPFETLRSHLGHARALFVTLRDGAAVRPLAEYLVDMGAGESTLYVCEHLGGPDEKITRLKAETVPSQAFENPVCAYIELSMTGPTLSLASGQADDLFENDGQITKRPQRALTLSALAPRDGEVLWDIGGGSGSISIEWCLAGKNTRAICLERDAVRAARIRKNAAAFGLTARIEVVEYTAPDPLPKQLETPDAVFVGGGLSHALLEQLAHLKGKRLVANAVTLESEALLAQWHASHGGALMRVELSQANAIGARRGWKASYPVVQWSVTL